MVIRAVVSRLSLVISKKNERHRAETNVLPLRVEAGCMNLC